MNIIGVNYNDNDIELKTGKGSQGNQVCSKIWKQQKSRYNIQ